MFLAANSSYFSPRTTPRHLSRRTYLPAANKGFLSLSPLSFSSSFSALFLLCPPTGSSSSVARLVRANKSLDARCAELSSFLQIAVESGVWAGADSPLSFRETLNFINSRNGRYGCIESGEIELEFLLWCIL